MELVFDTTGAGEDVRTYTDKMAGLMEPDENKIPPVVLFRWGTYKFQGLVETYKETIDFFAPTGVPLRASLSIGLSRQDKVFEPSETSSFDTQAARGHRALPLGVLRPHRHGHQGGRARGRREVWRPPTAWTSMRFPSRTDRP